MASGIDPPDVQGIGPYLQGLVDAFQESNHSQAAHAQQFAKQVNEMYMKELKNSLQNSTNHLQQYFNELEAGFEQTVNKITGHLDKITNKFDEIGEHSKKHQSSQPLGFWGGVNQITVALQLQERLQQVVHTMIELSRETDRLLRTFGGSQERLSQFTDSLVDIRKFSHLAMAEVIELGQAFQQEGISLANNNPGLKEYLKVTGEAMHMLDMSAESATIFTKNMMEIGKSSKDVANGYDSMYRTMQKYNLTIDDMSDSVTTASHLFAQFAMTSGQGVDALSKNIMETKALMKSLGEDSRQAGNVIAAELGSVDKRMQHAGMMSALLGGDIYENFNRLSTAEGQRKKRVAALMMVSRMSGPSLFQDPNKLSQQQQYQRTMRLFGGVEAASQGLGISSGDIQKELAEYQAARTKHPSLSISGFYEERQKEMESKQPAKSWQQGQDSFNRSIGQLGKNFEHLLTDLSIILGGPLMKVLNPLVEGLNFLLDAFIELEEKNPIVKFITEMAVVGIALGGVVGPIIHWAKALPPLFATLAEGATAILGGIKGGMGLFGGTSITPTAALTIFTPVLGAFFMRFENFFTQFIPRWVKDLWQGAMNSDWGKSLTSSFNTMVQETQKWWGWLQHGLESMYNGLPDWLKGTTQSSAAEGSMLQSQFTGLSPEVIRDVVKHGTSAATRQAIGQEPVSYDTGAPGDLAKRLKGYHPHLYKNAGIVAEEARKAGADPITMIATMMIESKGDENVSGDRGFFQGKRFISSKQGPATSFGLFQLHKGGRLTAAHLTPEMAFDARTNAHTQAGEFAKYARSHPNWTPGHIAAFTQGPADQARYAKTVDSLMPLAREIYANLQGRQSLMKTSMNDVDMSWYKKQQNLSEHSENTKLLRDIRDESKKRTQLEQERLKHQQDSERYKKRMEQMSSNDSLGKAAYFQKKLGDNVL